MTLQVLQEIGFPLTRELAASVVQDYLKHEAIANPFNNDCPGKDWWSGFIKRWKLSKRKPQHLSAKRAEGVLPEVVDAWLEKVKKVFQEVGLIKRGRAVKDLSNRMWNCDETAFCTSATSKTVIAKRGCRDVYETGGGSGTEYVTVLGAGSASGVRLPPYILYKAKHLYDTWCRAGPAGALYGVSPSGWMEQANFLSWFEKMLVPAVHHLLSKGPVFLFVDGHYSHVSIDLIKSATSHGIHLLCFPSHATAVLQPLDVGVYGPVKQAWRKILKEYKLESRASKIDRTVFPILIAKLWSQSFTKLHLQSGFRATGLYPLNQEAISESRIAVSAVYRSEGSKEQEKVTPSNAPSTPTRQHRERPPPTPQLRLHLKGHFTMLLQVKQQKDTSKKRRCESRIYGEALTSDEVLERIEEKEAQKKEKKGKKKGRKKGGGVYKKSDLTDDEDPGIIH